MKLVESILAMAIVVVLAALLASRLPLPRPLLFVAAGVGLSFIPGFDTMRLDPETFFLLFIPPLLFADGFAIPKREFLLYRYSILMLAFGLVFVTVAAVGFGVHALIPGISLAAACVLGAAVSPTDAVAVSSIAQRLPMPARVLHVLGGESLINDASGLVAFQFALLAVATGRFSWSEAVLRLVVVSIGGLLVGVAIAWLAWRARRLLSLARVNEAPLHTVLSLLTPYAAYLAGERLHVSGILAAVAAGLFAGSADSSHLTTETRLHSWDVWTLVTFVFNGFVFLLLGLELDDVVTNIAGNYTWPALAAYAALVSGVVIGVRLMWIVPAARLANRLNRLHAPDLPPPPLPHMLLVGWAGIRGTVTLAAALSIPRQLPSGPFPGRDLLVFLAASVILSTLLLNATTLPWLIARLRIPVDDGDQREARLARVETAQAAIGRLRTLMDAQTDVGEQAMTLRLIEDYQRRIDDIAGATDPAGPHGPGAAVAHAVRRAAVQAERSRLRELARDRSINDELMRSLMTELDHAESALSANE